MTDARLNISRREARGHPEGRYARALAARGQGKGHVSFSLGMFRGKLIGEGP